jgi:hypothetical protein
MPSALAAIGQLQMELRAERHRVAAAHEEMQRLRADAARMACEAEMEEEAISNRLIKRLEALKADKAALALACER